MLSLLTVNEKDGLRELAEQTPEALTRLGVQSSNDGLATLPAKLMGIYIQTL